MREQKRDTFSVVSPTNSLGESWRYVDLFDTIAPIHLVAKRHSVGNDYRSQAALVQGFDSIAGKYAVGNDSEDCFCAMVHHRLCCLCQSTTGVRHVIDDDCNLSFDVTDKYHA